MTWVCGLHGRDDCGHTLCLDEIRTRELVLETLRSAMALAWLAADTTAILRPLLTEQPTNEEKA